MVRITRPTANKIGVVNPSYGAVDFTTGQKNSGINLNDVPYYKNWNHVLQSISQYQLYLEDRIEEFSNADNPTFNFTRTSTIGDFNTWLNAQPHTLSCTDTLTINVTEYVSLTDNLNFQSLGGTGKITIQATATSCTLNDATEKLEATDHPFQNNDKVFIIGNWNATGLTVSEERAPFYVINATANDFQISQTQGGAAVGIEAYTVNNVIPALSFSTGQSSIKIADSSCQFQLNLGIDSSNTEFSGSINLFRCSNKILFETNSRIYDSGSYDAIYSEFCPQIHVKAGSIVGKCNNAFYHLAIMNKMFIATPESTSVSSLDVGQHFNIENGSEVVGQDININDITSTAHNAGGMIRCSNRIYSNGYTFTGV